MPLAIDKNSFIEALEVLESAFSYTKKMYQTNVLKEASRIMDEEGGMNYLYQNAKSIESSGIFSESPWEDPSKLQPRLVKGSLMASGMTSVLEVLSELRILAIATGKYKHQNFSKEDAKSYLNEVIALNLDILFPEKTEAARIEDKMKEKDQAHKLFRFLEEELSLKEISGILVDEIDRLTAQRPIMVNRIVSIIQSATELLDTDIAEKERKAIQFYIDAVMGSTKKSKQYPNHVAYRKILQELTDEELKEEAKIFSKYMRDTGLVSPHHAVLVRYLNRYKNENLQLMGIALGLNNKGLAELEHNIKTVSDLIKAAIYPATRQALYGLTLLLERGVLSFLPVIPGLYRLVELDLESNVSKVLLNSIDKNSGITANEVLVAGTISVLGQPLGVGQGMNPTCQTARGISLWSLHASGFLLELIARAARDGDVDLAFEGTHIHSKDLVKGLVQELHEELDAVSLILVPHLDRLYNELVRRVTYRNEDAHKWVNPAFYGNWVSKGFSSAFDILSGAVINYSGFVKLFYATHHTDYNDEHELIYPNPVGIFITNAFGNLLGFHAVSIQRIGKDPKGEYRIYFYNPNNDSSQNWGQNIKPSVRGNGEKPGESSLLFEQFVSRLYAFHYNPYEKGDVSMVEDQLVEKIQLLAKQSWGKEYQWVAV